jgi:hypothetical protein
MTCHSMSRVLFVSRADRKFHFSCSRRRPRRSHQDWKYQKVAAAELLVRRWGRSRARTHHRGSVALGLGGHPRGVPHVPPGWGYRGTAALVSGPSPPGAGRRRCSAGSVTTDARRCG